MWTAQIGSNKTLTLRAVLTTDVEIRDYVSVLRALTPFMDRWADYADALDVIHGGMEPMQPKPEL